MRDGIAAIVDDSDLCSINEKMKKRYYHGASSLCIVDMRSFAKSFLVEVGTAV